jgi:uncharacterized damage-inducible protein DinB
MKRTLFTIATMALLTMPAAAQDADKEKHKDMDGEHEMEMEMSMDHTDPVTSIWKLQDQFMGWIMQASEQATAKDYAFRPTPEVRSMGELLGHVAGANFTFCAAMKGEKSPAENNFEKASRAEIIAAFKAGKAYCAEAAEFAAAHHHDARNLFGNEGDVTWVTAFNVAHNAEHYGNLVTYFRMLGKVPPSSQ